MSRLRRVPAGIRGDRELVSPLMAFAAAAVRLSKIGPVTTELVRLRCARHHDCHT
jgi:hypothetical protein